MFLRVVPILMIVIPLLGFFLDPEPPRPNRPIDNIVFLLLQLPWYLKILSMGVGTLWLLSSFKSNSEEEPE